MLLNAELFPVPTQYLLYVLCFCFQIPHKVKATKHSQFRQLLADCLTKRIELLQLLFHFLFYTIQQFTLVGRTAGVCYILSMDLEEGAFELLQPFRPFLVQLKPLPFRFQNIALSNFQILHSNIDIPPKRLYLIQYLSSVESPVLTEELFGYFTVEFLFDLLQVVQIVDQLLVGEGWQALSGGFAQQLLLLQLQMGLQGSEYGFRNLGRLRTHYIWVVAVDILNWERLAHRHLGKWS